MDFFWAISDTKAEKLIKCRFRERAPPHAVEWLVKLQQILIYFPPSFLLENNDLDVTNMLWIWTVRQAGSHRVPRPETKELRENSMLIVNTPSENSYFSGPSQFYLWLQSRKHFSLYDFYSITCITYLLSRTTYVDHQTTEENAAYIVRIGREKDIMQRILTPTRISCAEMQQCLHTLLEKRMWGQRANYYKCLSRRT